MITLPPGSFTVTLTMPPPATPGVNVPLTFTVTDATVPLTVKVRLNGEPGVTVAVVVALPRTLPAPFGASYNVKVNVGVPAGALSGIVHVRPPLALVQRVEAGERSMTELAMPLTANTPETTDGETKCGLRTETVCRFGMRSVIEPFPSAELAGGGAFDAPPPQPATATAKTAAVRTVRCMTERRRLPS